MVSIVQGTDAQVALDEDDEEEEEDEEDDADEEAAEQAKGEAAAERRQGQAAAAKGSKTKAPAAIVLPPPPAPEDPAKSLRASIAAAPMDASELDGILEEIPQVWRRKGVGDGNRGCRGGFRGEKSLCVWPWLVGKLRGGFWPDTWLQVPGARDSMFQEKGSADLFLFDHDDEQESEGESDDEDAED